MKMKLFAAVLLSAALIVRLRWRGGGDRRRRGVRAPPGGAVHRGHRHGRHGRRARGEAMTTAATTSRSST